jgi:hypothetical protein
MFDSLPYDKLCQKIMSESSGDDEELGELKPHTRELFRKEFEVIRRELGNTFAEMFSRESELGHRRLHDAINTAISWKQWLREPIDQVESAFQGIYGLQAEVNNGGFHQFFFNSTGKYWAHILWLMQEAGDGVGVRRFTEVLSIFPKGQPAVSRRERWQQLSKMERWPWSKKKARAHFDKHDKEFYKEPFPDSDLFWKFLRQRMPSVPIIWP